jgi:hypothetical protein
MTYWLEQAEAETATLRQRGGRRRPRLARSTTIAGAMLVRDLRTRGACQTGTAASAMRRGTKWSACGLPF